ncbi:hypothetical protein NQZ68_007675 [Dissostichus eleginoides]|nr:hypothetical protein NQZ68_007675 [Dissostichus eleginoides]
MQSNGAGNQDWTVFSRTSLHPGSANDSQAAFPPLQPRGLCSARVNLKKREKQSQSELPPSISPSTVHRLHPEQWLILLRQPPLRGLWLGSTAGLRFQPHVLHSNQKSQPWQYGRIADGDTERKSTSREEEGGREGGREGRKQGGGLRK